MGDSDAHCNQGLECLQRTGDEPVPGCAGNGITAYDYCYNPACKAGGWCDGGFVAEAGAATSLACEEFCGSQWNGKWFAYNGVGYCMCYSGDCNTLTGNSTYTVCPVNPTFTDTTNTTT